MKEEIKDTISELVERFNRNKDVYKNPKYKETQLRREFLDPFFTALGWDMDNKQGHAEQYKDIVHEDTIKIKGTTKAPDYSFRIGGVRKFFIEAKKPAIDIKYDIHPSFQLRRYAWSAKLPISILTDFEEFSVYDCRIKPNKNDKASVGRIYYQTYDHYLDDLEFIYNTFSRDAILKGSFDKYTETATKKRGTSEVDQEFLKEIENWRDVLAKNIALRNKNLSIFELNRIVQLTIDRIIFLRIAEDRGIEDYRNLFNVGNKKNIYKSLFAVFVQADAKYNSGIFDFSNDKISKNILVDDKVLKPILQKLYYPDSPYEFSVLPSDILGNIYEQFLGKTIRLTASHQAKIEEKPEVRKAGGVYYTPRYIVDYIVKNTVGKKIKGKSPAQISKLTICDPACGSGSFLIQAYQYLLDYHLKYYQNDPAKNKNKIVEIGYKSYRLTTKEKKRILLNNIFGVDIDPQAVEVTKLSLLLKVLEGENRDTLYKTRELFQERALPNLSNNIKCGNSLIGTDFYDEQDMTFFENEDMRRINAFDWNKEFPQIFKTDTHKLSEAKQGDVTANSGFDVVIGNPPWGASFEKDELNYIRIKSKEIIVRMIDSFMFFVYHSIKNLRYHGSWGMIIPDVILYQNDNMKLRIYLLKKNITHILNLGDVFNKVVRPAAIIILQNYNNENKKIRTTDTSNNSMYEKKNIIKTREKFQFINQKQLHNTPSYLFITKDIDKYQILEKINQLPHYLLEEVVDSDGIQRGVSPDLKEAFIVKSEIVSNYDLEKTKLKQVLTGGRQLKRYYKYDSELFLIYTTRDDDFSKIPNICNYINKFRDKITCKEVKLKKHPLYSLHRPRKKHLFLKEQKILGVITEDEIIVSIDNEKHFVTDGLYLFGIKENYNINYVMGILNSRLFVFIYRLLSFEGGRVLSQVKPTLLNKLPIVRIDLNKKNEKQIHDKIVTLVDQMLETQKLYHSAKMERDKKLYKQKIDIIDNKIDKLVYALYGLTDEEIEIVEESVKR